MPKFPFYKQLDAMDCGPSCVRMIAKFYGKNYSLQTLRERSFITREGVSMLGMSEAAESIGFHSVGARITFDQLKHDVLIPCVVHWKQKHFVVVYKIDKKNVYVADPAHGLIKFTYVEFQKGWISTVKDGEGFGLCMILEPTPDFYKQEDEQINKGRFAFLFSYVRPYHKLIVQLILGIFLGTLLQLIFPFLFQSLVDNGIINRDFSFIVLVLIAQLVIVVSRMAVDFIRNWILLHLGTRVNIFLISDFLIKMMKLPIAFFDSKMIGDLIQRIGDHKRIESFLTSTTLNLFFAAINIVVLGIVLAIFSIKIFIVFIAGSILYLGWVFLFMKKRRELDNKKFAQLSHNQSSIIQLITGMQEIKLNNCETQKRWEWEKIQAALFRINVKGLSLHQYQQAGGIFFNEIKNILIIFIAANMVIRGEMTLGTIVAISYIIGQLGSPIEQVINFIHTTQDAKISLERLGEIHTRKDEEPVDQSFITEIPPCEDIGINRLSFQYEGPNSPYVLEDIDLKIEQGKVTAIVGTSGSGKTTLIKLLLGFYEPVNGEIKLGDTNLRNISHKHWRQDCGVVMQDGFIFSDTIARNIAVSDETVDKQQLLYAVKSANIQEMIEVLPLNYNTKIGQEGLGLSQGQKQRILIARAIYKDPKYIFLDEATNALDANNEKVIMNNLSRFFKGRTVIVVAHRLSTVKNADHIVVLEKGKIVEQGKHDELSGKKGAYYNLVKNQLELGL
jgi:ATP-binding cassette, subfamily B, bacterial